MAERQEDLRMVPGIWLGHGCLWISLHRLGLRAVEQVVDSHLGM